MRRRLIDAIASLTDSELGELEASIEAGRTERERERGLRLTPEPEREASHPGARVDELAEELERDR